MKFLKWFLRFFEAPRAALPATKARVKFLEGTEWICPACKATIAIARRDIHSGDTAMSSEWDIKDRGFWKMSHCGVPAYRYSPGMQIQFFTPTGWVG